MTAEWAQAWLAESLLAPRATLPSLGAGSYEAGQPAHRGSRYRGAAGWRQEAGPSLGRWST